MAKDDKDLRDVRRSEGRRGRRPINLEGQQEHEERRALVIKALQLDWSSASTTQEEFLNEMRAYGLGEDEIQVVLAVWREYRS